MNEDQLKAVEKVSQHDIDLGLQPERTSLAWERTGFSLIVVGFLMARYGLYDGFRFEAAIGSMVVLGGTVTLLWSASQYHDEQGPMRTGRNPLHPRAARLLGFASVFGCLGAIAIALHVIAERHQFWWLP